jgi:hypothetical protein
MEQRNRDFYPAILSREQLQKLESLEEELGCTIVAYEKSDNVEKWTNASNYYEAFIRFTQYDS